MNRSICVVIAALLVSILGCPSGAPVAGTFAAEIKPLEFAPGQKQDVELTVHYRLPATPTTATTVSYKAHLATPQGWTADTEDWTRSQALKTTDIGFRETRQVSITVPVDAIPGEHNTHSGYSPPRRAG